MRLTAAVVTTETFFCHILAPGWVYNYSDSTAKWKSGSISSRYFRGGKHMAKHDEFELRIVEVKGSLPAEQMPKATPAMPQPRPAPTRAEALEAVRSMKGAAPVIERIPTLGNINSWTEFAFWSALEFTGAAQAIGDGLFLWQCDFTPSFDLGRAYGNPVGEGMVYFAGVQPLVGPGHGGHGPAETLYGQVWCYLNVPPVSDFYLFVAQVMTDSESATIEWGIDTSVLGTVTLTPAGPYDHAFLVLLSPGLHRFVIRNVAGSMYFVSLTAWQIPYPVLQTAKHDESELRIVEVKGSLPVEQMRKPVPAKPQPRPAPTRAQALAAVKSMKGAASVIERIPNLGDTKSWTDVAYLSPLELTGTAQSIFLWHCDFTPGFDLGFAHGNPVGEGMVYFAGADLLVGPGGSVAPPARPLSGQVWCYLDVPVPGGVYIFVAQVLTYLDTPVFPYTATIECWFDTSLLGTVTLTPSGPVNHHFLVAIPSGLHRFLIQQVTGGVYFVSLTAWFLGPPR
jgi:hypothetical protein